MNTVLVPIELLELHLPELGRRAQTLSLAPEMLLGPHGEALLFSLLFERWPELVGEFSRQARFYNRYYWFLRFVVLHTETHGPDAGLEQQAFQILESAEFEIDSEILGRLEAEAGAGRQGAS